MPVSDDLLVMYSAGERSIFVQAQSQSLKCLFSEYSFVYDVVYYTMKTTAAQSIGVKKSNHGFCGLVAALEAVDGGCNIGSSGQNCLLIYGHPILSTSQPTTLPPGQSNTTFKVSYVFRNTFSAFRLIFSDLKQF